MNKDYIFITKADGSSEKMEIVATFRLEETSKDCIIYKSLNANDEHYYAASYDANTNYSNLDTNFSEEEKQQLNKIFETLKNGGVSNA